MKIRHCLEACRTRGLVYIAYCPLARGKVPSDEVLVAIGKAHGRSASQIALRYLTQQGIIAIPRTSKRERLKENLEIFDFSLTDAEMAAIAKLKRPDGRVVSPAHAPKWDN